MQVKVLTVAALCALAFPAAGVASHVTLPPTPENICGIDVITTETGSGVLKIVGSGVELNAFEIDLTYTNPANGKTVVLHGAELNEDTFSSPTDNGDGTISVFTKFAGVTTLTIPHGPPLAINAGELVRESRSTQRPSTSSPSKCSVREANPPEKTSAPS